MKAPQSLFARRNALGLKTRILHLMLLFFIIGCGVSWAAETPGFDHNETSFPLDFTHALVKCETCHIQSVFIGTPRRCVECHARGSRIQASSASLQHIRTTNDCEFCHQSGTWQSVYRVDHFAVTGSCQSCHNGVIATGKSTQHVQSSENCDDCHRTFSWTDAVFDHADISGNCISCHNGVIAEGKHAKHILSSSNCDDCHRTTGWVPLFRMDHNAVIGSCFSCHNGVVAEGKHDEHVASSNDCQFCHIVQGWLPATLNRVNQSSFYDDNEN